MELTKKSKNNILRITKKLIENYDYNNKRFKDSEYWKEKEIIYETGLGDKIINILEDSCDLIEESDDSYDLLEKVRDFVMEVGADVYTKDRFEWLERCKNYGSEYMEDAIVSGYIATDNYSFDNHIGCAQVLACERAVCDIFDLIMNEEVTMNDK